MGFWNLAAADPGQLAVVDPDGTEYSAGELLERSNRLVHALRSLGVERGDAVAVVLPNGILPLTCLLAAQQAGFYYVPINSRLAPPEIAYILRDSEAKVLIAHERFAATVVAAADEAGLSAAQRLGISAVDGFADYDALVAAQSAERPEARSAGVAMHYTSGTTGRPKGATLTHGNLLMASVDGKGQYTMTNLRNGFSKKYQAK